MRSSAAFSAAASARCAASRGGAVGDRGGRRHARAGRTPEEVAPIQRVLVHLLLVVIPQMLAVTLRADSKGRRAMPGVSFRRAPARRPDAVGRYQRRRGRAVDPRPRVRHCPQFRHPRQSASPTVGRPAVSLQSAARGRQSTVGSRQSAVAVDGASRQSAVCGVDSRQSAVGSSSAVCSLTVCGA